MEITAQNITDAITANNDAILKASVSNMNTLSKGVEACADCIQKVQALQIINELYLMKIQPYIDDETVTSTDVWNVIQLGYKNDSDC